MNKLILMAGVVAFAFMVPAPAAGQTEAPVTHLVDAGIKLCKSFEATGDVLSCVIRVEAETIDVTINTNRREAKSICYSAAFMLSQKTDSFSTFAGRWWILQIFSPYSDRPIANCQLH